jgi:hypothetical protein
LHRLQLSDDAATLALRSTNSGIFCDSQFNRGGDVRALIASQRIT